MPGGHRMFLQQIESIANIRDFAAKSTIPEVAEAYNFAVDELRQFREIHIQIVTRYIIRPSRQYAPKENSGSNLAVATSDVVNREKAFHGTGGTDLIPFLKQSRDETKKTALT